MPDLTVRSFIDHLREKPRPSPRKSKSYDPDDEKDFTWSLPSDGSGQNLDRLGLGPRNIHERKFAAALPPVGRINNLLTGSVSGGLDKSLTKLPQLPNAGAMGSTMPFGSMSVWGDTPFPKAVGAVSAPMSSGMAQATGAASSAGGLKAAALAGLAQRGAQALVAPGKKVIGRAFDVQGHTSNAATLASNTLDLSNMQRPADYMKTLGKMQDPLDMPGMAELPKVAATRMAREGYGALDRALRFVNKADPYAAPGAVNRRAQKLLAFASDARLSQVPADTQDWLRQSARTAIHDQIQQPFDRGATAASTFLGTRTPSSTPGAAFSHYPLHPDTIQNLNNIQDSNIPGVNARDLLSRAADTITGRRMRQVSKRVANKANTRMQDLATQIGARNSLLRHPQFRDTAAWDGHIGKSFRTQVSQAQNKNRRMAQGAGTRAQEKIYDQMYSLLKSTDLSPKLQAQAMHDIYRRPAQPW